MARQETPLLEPWPDEEGGRMPVAGDAGTSIILCRRDIPQGDLAMQVTVTNKGKFQGASWLLQKEDGSQITYNLFEGFGEFSLQIEEEKEPFAALYDEEGQISSIHPITLPPMSWRRNLKAVSTQEIPGYRQIYFNGSGWMVSILTGEKGKASEIGWDQVFVVDGYSAWFSRSDEEKDSKILFHQYRSGLKRVTEFPQAVDYEALRELVKGKVNWYKVCQICPADSWLDGNIKDNSAGENLGSHEENQRRAQIVSLPAARKRLGRI